MFGYEYQDVSGDGFRYAMLMVDGREVGGIGQYVPGTPAGTPAAWSAYFAVDDTDAAVASAVEHGGSVVRAHQGQPVRPDRRRHRQPGRDLLADHQPSPGKPARWLVVLFRGAHQHLLDRHVTGLANSVSTAPGSTRLTRTCRWVDPSAAQDSVSAYRGSFGPISLDFLCVPAEGSRYGL